MIAGRSDNKMDTAGHGERLLLTDAHAAALAGVGRRTWWRLVSAGQAPSPVKLPGTRSTRWRRGDIEDWIEQLK